MLPAPPPPCRLAFLAVVALAVAAASCPAARGEDPVAVLVTGPLAAKVGDRVAFEVEIVNRSGRPLEKLRVIDYFDKGFHHEASASPIEQKGTIDLAAGTSRRLTLDFLLDEPGRQCHRVEILDQSHTFLGGATACVQVAANPGAAPVAAPVAAPAIPPPPTTAYPATTYPPTASPPAPVAVPTPPLSPPPVASAPLAPPPTAPAAIAPPLPSIAPPPVAAPVMAAPVIPAPVIPAPAVPAPVIPAPAVPAPAVPAPVVMATPAPVVATNSVPATAPPAVASLELDLAGPAEVPAGGIAEFVATVRNTGAVASGPTTLEFGWENAFTPQEATDGYNLLSSKVSWTLPTIEPGAQVKRQINLKADGPEPAGGRSCVRAVLTGQVGGTMVADESCVVIRSTAPRRRTPREVGLRVTLADCDDPVIAGSPTTLVCTVVNAGTTPSGRLDLTIDLPERSSLVGDPTPSRVRIDGRRITFDSLASIPPGGQTSVELAYRMPASIAGPSGQAAAPAAIGTGVATAVLRGAELDGSAESSCQTTFLTP